MKQRLSDIYLPFNDTLLQSKVERLHYEEMMFHSLENELPNIVNLHLHCIDCCHIEISNDGKIVAAGRESGKIELFEMFDTFGPSSRVENISRLIDKIVVEFIEKRLIL